MAMSLLACFAAALAFDAAEAADAAATAATGSGDDSLAVLVDKGTAALSFRYRYEYVDDARFAEEAHASTVRSRLSLQSGTYRDFSFFVEADDVREIGADDFNAGAGNTPDRVEYPVVADPEGTEVNQAYLDYTGITSTRLRLGRQRINLDNQRFVGGVAWRQNEQTFDAASVDWSDARSRVFYAAVDNVNRIYGEDVQDGDHRQAPTHLVNLSTTVGRFGRLGAYHYAIDNDDVASFSTATSGLRLAGETPVGNITLIHLLEYAHQSDLADNPVEFDADYWHLSAGARIAALEAALGWEVLGGDDDSPGEAFRTPLATLHAFNGWADQFLTTPDAGLDDLYVAVKATHGDWVGELRAHRFRAEDGSDEYGREADLRIGYRFGPHLLVDLFAAAFDADDVYEDVTKAWLMVTVEL
jgi:hypothetical protein